MTYVPADRVGVEGLHGLRDHLVDRAGAPGMARDGRKGWRVERLVVARESDEYDSQVLQGMVLQTLDRFRDQLPASAYAVLRGLGIAPVKDPAGHGAILVEEQGLRAVLFERDGVWCLYSQGSAARKDAKGDNAFVTLLERVFGELKPRNVYVATFSRLVRNQDYVGRVLTACADVDVVHCESTLRMDSETSRMMFTLFGAFSDMERNQQLLRLALGRLAKHERGEWRRGPAGVPLGYRLDGKQVVPDPRARHVVLRMLELLGSDASTSAGLAADLGAMGVAAPSQTGRGWAYPPPDGGEWGPHDKDLGDAVRAARRKGASLATLADPKGYQYKLYEDLDLWRTGTLAATHQVPGTAARIGAHDVKEKTLRDGRVVSYVDLPLVLGLPDDGPWAPDAVLAAAEARKAEIKARSGGATAARGLLPLLACKARWSDDGKLWALSNGRGQSNSYRVISIGEQDAAALGGPSKPGLPFDGWDRGGRFRGHNEARIDAADLHKAIADAAVEAFKTGIDVRVLPPRGQFAVVQGRLEGLPSADPAADPVPALRDAAEAAAAAARNATRAFASYPHDDNPDVADALKAAMEDTVAESTRAQARLERAERREPDADAPPPPVEVDAPADLLLEALARLATTPGSVPRDVAERIGRVFAGIRIKPGPVWAGWEASLRVPTADGELVLGPLAGQVRNRIATRYDPEADGPRPRQTRTGARTPDLDDAFLQAVLGEGVPMSEVLNRNGEHGRGVRLALARRLQQPPYSMRRNSAEALMACPVGETRRAVWDMACGRAPDPSLPDGFADHLREAYLDGPGPPVRKWWVYVRPRDDVNALFLAAGGSMLSCHAKAAFRGAGIPEWFLTDLTHRAGGRQHLFLVPNPAGKQRGCCRRTNCPSNLLTLMPCPHCGGWATLAARVPEVPGGLLCPDCLRMPVDGSPVFPEDYGLLGDEWVQARQEAVAPDLAAYRAKDEARAARRCEDADARPAAGTPARRTADADQAELRAWAVRARMRLKGNRPVPRWVAELRARALAEASAAGTSPALPAERSAADVRRWAVACGLDVPSRGRLPHAAWDAYDEAAAGGPRAVPVEGQAGSAR